MYFYGYSGSIKQIIIKDEPIILTSTNRIYYKHKFMQLLDNLQEIAFINNELICKFKNYITINGIELMCDNYFVLKDRLFIVSNNKVIEIQNDKNENKNYKNENKNNDNNKNDQNENKNDYDNKYEKDIKNINNISKNNNINNIKDFNNINNINNIKNNIRITLEYKIERSSVFCDTIFLFSSTYRKISDIKYDFFINTDNDECKNIIFIYSCRFVLIKTIIFTGKIKDLIVGKYIIINIIRDEVDSKGSEILIIDYVNDEFKIYKKQYIPLGINFLNWNNLNLPKSINKVGFLTFKDRNILVISGDTDIYFYEIDKIILKEISNFNKDFYDDLNLLVPENSNLLIKNEKLIFKIDKNKVIEEKKIIVKIGTDDFFIKGNFKLEEIAKFSNFHITENNLFLESDLMLYSFPSKYLILKCNFVYKDIFVFDGGVYYKNFYQNLKFVAFYENLICTDNDFLYVFDNERVVNIVKGVYLYDNIFKNEDKFYTFEGNEIDIGFIKDNDKDNNNDLNNVLIKDINPDLIKDNNDLIKDINNDLIKDNNNDINNDLFNDDQKYQFVKKIGKFIYRIKNNEIDIFNEKGELEGNIVIKVKSYCYSHTKLYLLSDNELTVFYESIQKYSVDFDEIFSVFDEVWIIIFRFGFEFYKFQEINFFDEIDKFVFNRNGEFGKLLFFGSDFNTKIIRERYDDLEKMTVNVEKLSENTELLKDNARKLKEKMKNKNRWFW
ncbi:hypothetical protein DMUE_3418 [Dictyocoela muelleri]|nr:hypothetical protein DMUE_3418 [Dictyocoela muelleri]